MNCCIVPIPRCSQQVSVASFLSRTDEDTSREDCLVSWAMEFTTLRPMLASTAEVALDAPQFVYEPKYDGIRVLLTVEARTGAVHIASRLGNDKTSQFPDLVR